MNKKGITLIALSVTVAVMAILAGFGITIGTNANLDAKKTKFQNEINQIEILVENYIRRNSGNDLQPYEWDVALLRLGYIEQLEGEEIFSDKVQTYIVDLEKIDAVNTALGSLKNGEKDRYLYSEKTGKVYYEKGITIGKQRYYRIDKLEE